MRHLKRALVAWDVVHIGVFLHHAVCAKESRHFFDAILQQKEGYSDYRWEDLAAEVLKNNPELKQKLEAKKQSDSRFAKDASAQLNFIYRNSPYYEPGHLRYPVYRLN